MKLFRLSILFLFYLTIVISASPVTRYVSLSGNNISPYTSWETATKDIQTAINQSSDGDLILVGNGTYFITSNISVKKGITIRSLNGSSNVTIDGKNVTRCFYVDHPDAIIDGFTITKGYNPQGFGGGADIVSGGTLQNCIITKCQARDGGGVAIDEWGLVQNCIIKGNKADNDSCTCSGYGGGVRIARGGIARGCLVYGNTSTNMGGGINIWDEGTIQNCTIINNTAPNGAGIRFRGKPVMENTISYFNNGANWTAENGCALSLSHNCTTPALPSGAGNINSDPLFVNRGAENFNLSPTSPCIDAGINQAWMTPAKDINGCNRIISGTVDIGVYECEKSSPQEVPPVPVVSYPKGGISIYPLTPVLCWYINGSFSGLTFRVKYSTDPGNTNKNGDLKTIDVGSACFITLPELDWGKTYYWQVMSTNGVLSSNYCAIESFSTTACGIVIAPEVPIPAWPVGGAMVYLSSTYLTWYTLSGGSNIVSYIVRWGENGNLNNVIEGIKGLTVQITGLLPAHHYQWRVESVDRQGIHSHFSEIQDFYTSGGVGNKLYTPVQAWPTGGTIVYMTSPLITWYLTQPTFGITEFRIRYSKNPDMSGAVEIRQSGIIYTVQLMNLEKGRTYYWQVQSYDGHVYSDPQTPPASFTIYSDYCLYIPIAQDPIGGVGLNSNTVLLSWATLCNNESIKYNLQYSTTPDFKDAVEIKELAQTSFKANNITNSIYYWRVQTKAEDGTLSEFSPTGKFFVQGVTGIFEQNTKAEGFSLFQNYPNPFNPSTSIQFNLPSDSYVTIEIFNSIGKSVGKIFEGYKPQGLSSLEFNAGNLPSGLYFYKIIAVEQNGKTNYDIKKMMLLK